MQEKRNVNIELIRIVAMLAVIIHHYFRHGGDSMARVWDGEIYGFLGCRCICICLC